MARSTAHSGVPGSVGAAWRAKVNVSLVLVATNVFGYFALNRHSFERYYEVPSTVLDGLPLVPWTIVVYFSAYLLVPVGIWLQPTRDTVVHYLVAALVAYAVGFAILGFLPTRIERPAAGVDGSIWLWLLRFTQSVDRPATCFPSLHMTNCFLSVFVYRNRPLAVWLLAWSLLIGASTLTTGQHFFLDLPAGVIVALIGTVTADCLWRRRGARPVPDRHASVPASRPAEAPSE